MPQEISIESVKSIISPSDGNIVNLNEESSLHTIENEYYIPNWNYFYSIPKHAENNGTDNPTGTCTTVAIQMMLGYHNYYTDSNLIPNISEDGQIRFLSEGYGDVNDHPKIKIKVYEQLGGSEIGTEDSVYSEIFKLTPHGNLPGGQNYFNVINATKSFLNKYSKINSNVEIRSKLYKKDDALLALNAGRPIILVFDPILAESEDKYHVVPAYGYANIDGNFGYIVHYGHSAYKNYMWVPESWIGYLIDMEINHTHNFEETNIKLNINEASAYKVFECKDCHCKNIEEVFIFDDENATIIGTKLSLASDVNIPRSIVRLIKPRNNKEYIIHAIGDYAFEDCETLNKITIDENILSIGKGVFKNCSNLTNCYIKGNKVHYLNMSDYLFEGCTKLHYISIPDSITSIGKEVFYGCTSLQSITIPEGVTSIGFRAFNKCSNLQTVNWQAKNCTVVNSEYGNIFDDCSSINTITIGNKVQTIPAYVFSRCANVEKIDIPSSVTSIGDGAFMRCSGLTYVEIPASVINMGSSVFISCTGLEKVKINNNKIGNYEFSGCEKLNEVQGGNEVTSIGAYAFNICDSLKQITIPEKVVHIYQYAFNNCTNLEEIKFEANNCNDFGTDNKAFSNINSSSLKVDFNCVKVPDYVLFCNLMVKEICLNNKVRSIGENSFYNCTVQNVYIREGANNICEGVFRRCNELTKIEVETGNTTYKSENNCLIRKSDNALIMACKTSTIPNSVKKITRFAYKNLEIPSLVIPNTVTQIENEAFNGCTWLKELSLPIESEGIPVWQSFDSLFEVSNNEMPYSVRVNINNGTKVHEGAFSHSRALLHVTLPNTIEVLCDNAFSYCSFGRILLPNSLKNIYGAFIGCSNLQVLRVPDSVEFIAENAFKYCYDLQIIEFERTAAQGITIIQKGALGVGTLNLQAIAVPDLNSFNMYVNQFIEHEEPQLADIMLSGELKFTLLDNESYSVAKGSRLVQGTINIPAYYNGKPVTVIEQGAFKGCDLITLITIPETVSSIGSEAFADCENLLALQINKHSSQGIIDFADDIFGDMTYLLFERFILQDAVTYNAYVAEYPDYEEYFVYYESDLIYQLKDDGTYKILGAVEDESLSDEEDEDENLILYIPSYYNGTPISEIAAEAFMNGDFKTVLFMGGSKITTIGDKAFYNCLELSAIEIPASVDYIGVQAFAGTDLKSITLRSYVEVDSLAFSPSVTVYTDAASVPQSWYFVNGHYIFFNCKLSDGGNYVETICVQGRNDYEGIIYEPYRAMYFGVSWGISSGIPYFITEYNLLVSYSFDEIIDGVLPVGQVIYAIMGFATTI